MRILILFEIIFFTAAEKESLRKSHEILAQGNNKSGAVARLNSSVQTNDHKRRETRPFESICSSLSVKICRYNEAEHKILADLIFSTARRMSSIKIISTTEY